MVPRRPLAQVMAASIDLLSGIVGGLQGRVGEAGVGAAVGIPVEPTRHSLKLIDV